MKYKTIFLIFLSILFKQDIKSQNDTLNKFNANGKKTGYWKILLDEKTNPTQNLSESYFYCFELWDEGQRVTPIDRYRWKKNLLTINKPMPYKGIPVPISGNFKWFNRKGRFIAEEVYANGNPIYFKSYKSKKSDTIDYIDEHIDFTKKYNNITGTFYIEMYSSSSNKLKKSWFRKGPKGWRCYKIKD
jgi:hypothetical protein